MRSPRFTPWLLVVTLTAAGAAAALGYGLTAPKEYRAAATMLVTPVSGADSVFAGLDVFRDPAAAGSAAALVRTPQVADAVRAQLGLRRSSDSLRRAISARVLPGSDVVEVRAHDTSAASAAQLANAFVDALVAQRSAGFQSQLAAAVERDARLLRSTRPGPQAKELARRLVVLRGLQGRPDPTLRRASAATAPASSTSAALWQLVLLGAAAGLACAAVLSLGLALAHRRRGAADDELRQLEARRRDLDEREQALDARERLLEERPVNRFLP